MIDVESARIGQMATAAAGASDIPTALLASGYTMSEIVEYLPDVIELLRSQPS